MTEVDAASKRAQRISILGVPVDRVSMEETLELVDTYVSGDAPRLIVTADASGIAQAQEEAKTSRAMELEEEETEPREGGASPSNNSRNLRQLA